MKIYLVVLLSLSAIIIGCALNRDMKLNHQSIDSLSPIVISKATFSWFNSPIPTKKSGYIINIECEVPKYLILDSLTINSYSIPYKSLSVIIDDKEESLDLINLKLSYLLEIEKVLESARGKIIAHFNENSYKNEFELINKINNHIPN